MRSNSPKPARKRNSSPYRAGATTWRRIPKRCVPSSNSSIGCRPRDRVKSPVAGSVARSALRAGFGMNTGSLRLADSVLAEQVVADVVVAQRVEVHEPLDQARYENHDRAHGDRDQAYLPIDR